MSFVRFPLRAMALAVAATAQAFCVSAQTIPTVPAPEPAPAAAGALPTVTVEASADASAEGLTKPFAGGQVARGGRVGILGNQDIMSTPFSTTSFTNELIQNQQAKSVGDVLQNDPSVRVARGFGNFQESYFIRGFIVGSDDTAYNGLYSLLPRQYIASELFERVEVLRGPGAFLNGAAPNGGGVGGAINLLPKRAGNEPLTELTLGAASGSQFYGAVDIARRFGPDQSLGVRVNAARRDGGTGVDEEDVELSVASVGLDWRSRNVRLSADVGYQDHRLSQTRTNVDLFALGVPTPPDASTNWGQPWTYSNESDTFGTVRGEFDLSANVTAWFAGGMRKSFEANRLANIGVTDALTGDGSTYRFDNTRRDDIKTGELGIRGKFNTGSVSHQLVAAYSYFGSKRDNAYGFDFANQQATNLYNPVYSPLPAFGPFAGFGNDLNNPALTDDRRFDGYAIGDTLGFMNDKLLLTLGLRYQQMKIDSYSYASAFGPRELLSQYNDSRTSPIGGIVWKATDALSVYANYVEGLTPGETAPALVGGLPVANVGEMLSPYVSKQKEVGVKFERGGLGASAAYFTIDKPRALRNSAGFFVAEGKDQHQGVELNVFGEPMRGLRLLGGVTFLDAQQKDTGDVLTDGKKVIGVPKAQGTIGVEWDVPGLRGLTLDGRMIASDDSYANATNTLRVAGWARFDVGARYVTEVGGKLLTLRGRIENVAGRDYWSSVGGYPGAGYLVLGNPRTFNLTASMEF